MTDDADQKKPHGLKLLHFPKPGEEKPPAEKKPAANQDVVDTLERWTKEASEGSIQAVALVGVYNDTSVVSEWVEGDEGSFERINIGVDLLKRRMLDAAEDDSIIEE